MLAAGKFLLPIKSANHESTEDELTEDELPEDEFDYDLTDHLNSFKRKEGKKNHRKICDFTKSCKPKIPDDNLDDYDGMSLSCISDDSYREDDIMYFMNTPIRETHESRHERKRVLCLCILRLDNQYYKNFKNVQKSSSLVYYGNGIYKPPKKSILESEEEFQKSQEQSKIKSKIKFRTSPFLPIELIAKIAFFI